MRQSLKPGWISLRIQNLEDRFVYAGMADRVPGHAAIGHAHAAGLPMTHAATMPGQDGLQDERLCLAGAAGLPMGQAHAVGMLIGQVADGYSVLGLVPGAQVETYY